MMKPILSIGFSAMMRAFVSSFFCFSHKCRFDFPVNWNLHVSKLPQLDVNCGSFLFSLLPADDAVIGTGGELIDEDVEQAERQECADVGENDQP